MKVKLKQAASNRKHQHQHQHQRKPSAHMLIAAVAMLPCCQLLLLLLLLLLFVAVLFIFVYFFLLFVAHRQHMPTAFLPLQQTTLCHCYNFIWYVSGLRMNCALTAAAGHSVAIMMMCGAWEILCIDKGLSTCYFLDAQLFIYMYYTYIYICRGVMPLKPVYLWHTFW